MRVISFFSLSDISRKIVAMGMTRETEKVDTYPPQEILQRPNKGFRMVRDKRDFDFSKYRQTYGHII